MGLLSCVQSYHADVKVLIHVGGGIPHGWVCIVYIVHTVYMTLGKSLDLVLHYVHSIFERV